jgi:hypothetical protein
VSRIWAVGVDWDKHTNGLWAPERRREPRGGREIARLDRRQPLAPGPKRVRERSPGGAFAGRLENENTVSQANRADRRHDRHPV